jgi:hypothetical protein
MESSPPNENRGTGAAATLCTTAASSLAGVYVLTASIPVTIIAAAVVLAVSTAYLVVHR